MTVTRSAIQEFSTGNKLYVNAIVTLFTVDGDGVKTTTKATLYADVSGSTELPNPQTLDSYGKFKRPVYTEVAVIASVTGLGIVPTHDTGIILGGSVAIDAQASADAASASATLAQAWATQLVTPVSGGLFSAKYNANLAAASAVAAALSETNAGTYAGTASTAATTATTQAGIATAKAVLTAADVVTTGANVTSATTQAGIATTQAGIATTQAAAALVSAGNAATSEINAAASAARLTGTSASSVAVGTGSQSFTTQASKFFTAGTFVTIASSGTPANTMFGQVTSYSGTALVVNVTATTGSGTDTDWIITIAGARGAAGIAGAVSDGTYGDVTVSGTGATWAVNNVNVTDSNFNLKDNGDATKQAKFEASGITAGNIRTVTLFDASGTMVLDSATQTLSNKTLTTPVLGVATATTINKVTITQPATAATLTIANNKTLTGNNSLTLAGTDATTITFQGTDTYVGRTTTDTLTNKTLTSPAINNGTISGTSIDNAVIGATTKAAAGVTNLTVTGTTTLSTSLTGVLSATAGVVSAAALSSNVVVGCFEGLKITNNVATPNTKADVTANVVLMIDSSGNSIRKTSLSVTVDFGTTGAAGLDTGAQAVSTWYYFWAVAKSDGTTSAISSTSNTAPTMPSGYTYKKYLGAMYSNGSTQLLRTLQFGRRTGYVVVGSSSVPRLPQMSVGSTGSITTPTWTAVAVAGFIPPTAGMIRVLITTTNGNCMFAPNNSYGAMASTTNPPYSNREAATQSNCVEVPLESTNVYFAADGSGSQLCCMGWEDYYA